MVFDLPYRRENVGAVPISSRSIETAVKNRLNDPRFKEGISIDDTFFSFEKDYPTTLTSGEPLSRKNVAQPLIYTSARLPEDLFKGQENIELVLTNDNARFLQGSGLKTAKARRRWYVVEEDKKHNKKTIYLQIRDNQLETSTDLGEIMSLLGIVSIARKSTLRDLKPLKFKPDDLRAFQGKDIKIKLDFDVSRKSAAEVLIEQLKRHPYSRSERHKNENMPFLLMGNDFSLRLLMMTTVINKDQVDQLKKMFSGKWAEAVDQFHNEHDTNKILKIKEEFMTDRVSEIDRLLDEKNIPPLYKDFFMKYTLLTLLDRNRHLIGAADKFHNQIFTEENYKKLGYKRLLYGVRSPLDESNRDFERSVMGEPIDYWDPVEFSKHLEFLGDESDPIKQIFQRLIDKKQPLLSISYVIGGLSIELVEQLIRNGLISREEIGFIGKVGHYVDGDEPHLQRGDLAIISSCYSPDADMRAEVENNIKFQNELSALVGMSHAVSALTSRAVTVQTHKELENARRQERELTNDEHRHLVVDMEQFYLINKLKELGTKYYSVFYISDISRNPKKILLDWFKGNDAEKITNPLSTVRGALAVALSTLIVIDSLVQPNGSDNGIAK